MSITKKYNINGPINIIRLTNNDKILYIMGDIHYNYQEQTECIYDDKYDSIDIDKFLLLFMKNNNKKQFDLFIETENTNFKSITNNNYKETYINSIKKLFQYYLIKNKTEIMINPKYPNFRFHYSDNRNTLLNDLYIYYFYNNNIENKDILNINIAIIYQNLKEMIEECIKSLKDNSSINKILNKYSHKEIKIIINIIYKNYVLVNFEYLLSLINKLISTYLKLTKYLIIEQIYKISKITQDIWVLISDLFFIRRFLDKNYIKNGILYTGQRHLENIMYLLVKYLNFKVTHVYNYTNINKINNYFLNTSFKKLNHIDEISNNFFNKSVILNSLIIQCSNLFDFPENFN